MRPGTILGGCPRTKIEAKRLRNVHPRPLIVAPQNSLVVSPEEATCESWPMSYACGHVQ